MAAVRQNGHSLWYIPKKFQIFEDVCLTACTNDGYAINFVPD